MNKLIGKGYSQIVADDIISEPYAKGTKFTSRPDDPYNKVTIESLSGDAVVTELPVELFRYGLPLSGRGFQADVSVCCHTVSVHNDAYPSLVSFGIDVIKSHDVDSLVLEITGGCQLEVLRMQRTAAAKQCQDLCK